MYSRRVSPVSQCSPAPARKYPPCGPEAKLRIPSGWELRTCAHRLRLNVAQCFPFHAALLYGSSETEGTQDAARPTCGGRTLRYYFGRRPRQSRQAASRSRRDSSAWRSFESSGDPVAGQPVRVKKRPRQVPTFHAVPPKKCGRSLPDPILFREASGLGPGEHSP